MKNKTPATYKKFYITLRILSIILFILFPIIGNLINEALGAFIFIIAITSLIFSIKYHKQYNILTGITYTNEEKKKHRKRNILTSAIVVILTFVSMGVTMDTPEKDLPVSVVEKDSEETTTIKSTTSKSTTTQSPTTTQSLTTTEPPTTTESPTTTQSPTEAPEPEPPVQVITEAPNISYSSDMVWIVDTGKKYHNRSSCSNMKNPYQVSKDEAIASGRDACKKCYR